MESLRDEQKRIARDRIIEALAAEVTENGLLDLSMAAVAERAGLSQRTIYNYFETKEALVGSLEDWSEEWMERHGGPVVLHDLDKIPEALVTNFQLFDDMGDVATAMVRIRSEALNEARSDERFSAGHAERTTAIRSSLSTIRPDLSAEDLTALTAAFRLVSGFTMWNGLTNEYGLTAADAGRVAGWAFSAMLDSVRNGDGPHPDN